MVLKTARSVFREDMSKQADDLGNKGPNWETKGVPEKTASSDWKMYNQKTKLTERFIQMAKVQEINQWPEKYLSQQLT